MNQNKPGKATQTPMESAGAFFPLGDGFPAIEWAQWRKMAEKTLKGRPFQESLVSQLREGIELQPIYTDSEYSQSLPSSFMPSARGVSARGGMETGRGGADSPGKEGRSAKPEVRQIYTHHDLAATRLAIMRDLDQGAASLSLGIAPPSGQETKDRSQFSGLPITGIDDFAVLLEGVDWGKTGLALQAGSHFLAVAGLFLAYCQHHGVDQHCLQLELHADPLGAWAKDGDPGGRIEQALHDMADLAVLFDDLLPHGKAVGVESAPYSQAGCDAGQELACMVACGLAYLKVMMTRGLSLEAATRQMVFTVSAEADIFLTIAKFRALRVVWARIVAVMGGDDARTQSIKPQSAGTQSVFHACTALRMFTRRDPWVNILRSTVAAFAASIGGAEVMMVHDFDYALGAMSDSGRRIARNMTTILREESQIGRVIDPAGGSWYVETLTRQLAERTWEIFQWIEAQGGMVAVLKDGQLAQKVAQSYQSYRRDIACRIQPLTGVSAFPDIHEQPIAAILGDESSLLEEAASPLPAQGQRQAESRFDQTAIDQAWETLNEDRVGSTLAAARAGAGFSSLVKALSPSDHADRIPPWPCYQLADDFEALRDASDAYKARYGQRPCIFLANMGPISEHGKAADFARNLFESGGIECLSHDGVASPDESGAAFEKSRAHIACVCGCGPMVAENGADFVTALKTAGAQSVYVVGSPGGGSDETANSDVEAYLYDGIDAVAITRQIYETLGQTGEKSIS